MIDTAVVVSALLFERGRVSFVREAWSSGRLVPLGSTSTVSELIRMLGYPKFRLTQEEVSTLLAAYLPFVETVAVVGDLSYLPECSDTNDQMFVELCHLGGADVLVTGDQALLDLTDKVEFDIVKPSELKKRL